MPNTQLIILLLTILGSQWASFLYLSSRIDRLTDELEKGLKQIDLKLDQFLKEKLN